MLIKIVMKAIGKMIKKKDKDPLNMQMEMFIVDFWKMIKKKEMDYKSTPMGIFIMEIGEMIKDKEKV